MKLPRPCLLLLLVLLVITVCGLPSFCIAHAMPDALQQVAPAVAGKISYTIIPAADHTFGYNIYKDGRLLVHQPVIPCLPGTKGFHKKADAQKTALMVMQKIRHGIMPPTISINELESIGILLK